MLTSKVLDKLIVINDLDIMWFDCILKDHISKPISNLFIFLNLLIFFIISGSLIEHSHTLSWSMPGTLLSIDMNRSSVHTIWSMVLFEYAIINHNREFRSTLIHFLMLFRVFAISYIDSITFKIGHILFKDVFLYENLGR